MQALKFSRFYLLCSVMAILSLASCQEDQKPEPTPVDHAKAVFTEIRDINQDGQPELIIGFEQSQIERLEKDEVVLRGLFYPTDTRFVTDPFRVQR